ncbi:hypothetical protein [Acinetobacter sp. CFCC 10889]|uniref:hypothetical protein n=1 Tax=Acinetobacter sp. CFCC 10889 TaxID=1775557 RepID=UPI000DD04BCB|nr:hypothetical protein [Acinetobacter sp. CFCC 10889]
MIKHDLIEQVGGIEKAKAIVEGAPDSYYCTGISDYTDGYDDVEKCPDCVSVQDLRTAIAQHESNNYQAINHCNNCGNCQKDDIYTDSIKDIRNHISLNTKVINHG